MGTHTVKGLLGQPVITVDAGKRVGSIQEILFSSVEGRATGIILSKPPVAGATKAVMADHIALLGVDVTLIDTETSVQPLSEPPSSQTGVRASTAVMRTQVITTEGRRIGEVSDIAIDSQGTILGYHLSHNILRDTFRGKPFLPAAIVRAVGDDALLVDAQGLHAAVEAVGAPAEVAAIPAEADSEGAEQPEVEPELGTEPCVEPDREPTDNDRSEGEGTAV